MILDEIREIINTIRINKAMVELVEIDTSTKLREDCGFDSLDLAELTVRLEVIYGVDIFAKGNIFTIRDIVDQLD